MSQNINQPEGYITESKAKALTAKWRKVLDYKSDKLPPIESERVRLNTAILFENQERWCLNEANTAGTGGVFGTHQPTAGAFSGDRYAAGDYRLPKVVIPMIRRTFPELITNEIVGVQPMSGPVGLAFAIRYKYDATPLGGQKRDNNYPYDGNANSPIPGWRSASDGDEMGYNYLNTAFTGTSSAQMSSGEPDFEILPADQGVAELLGNFELTANIPQINTEFMKTAVEAGTRRLASTWSVELEQDLKNMNGLDIDNEVTNAMSYELQAEIDREIIMRIARVALQAGDGPGYSFWNAPSADGRWEGERSRTLYSKILVESGRIAVRNRRGSANFLIATPRVCAILETMPEFAFFPVQGNVNTQPTGVAKVGTLAGRFNVYRDTRTEAQYQAGARNNPLEYVILGFKGSEYYDTGIVYCPYIPVMIQRTIGPTDFAPRVGLMTRYGVIDHIFGADLYYHLIIVKGLGEPFVPGTGATYFG